MFGAPGITDPQREKLVDLLGKMNGSAEWKKTLETRKWTDVFMSERPFERQIAKDIADTEAVLKDLGLA